MKVEKPINVLVGSENPVKAQSVKAAFEKFFPLVKVVGISVASGVPDQPLGDDTLIGAQNRAQALLQSHLRTHRADYVVGVEGGVVEWVGEWFSLGAVCVLNRNNQEGLGTSPWFPLPKAFVQAALEGQELGKSIDSISGERNTKQKGGAIGYFTQQQIDRADIYTQGTIMALIPFLNPTLFVQNS